MDFVRKNLEERIERAKGLEARVAWSLREAVAPDEVSGVIDQTGSRLGYNCIRDSLGVSKQRRDRSNHPL